MKKLANYYNTTEEILNVIIENELDFVDETLKEAAEIKNSKKRNNYIKNTYGYNFKFKLVSLLIEIDLECINKLHDENISEFLKNNNFFEKIAFLNDVSLNDIEAYFSTLSFKVQTTFNYLFGLYGKNKIDYERLIEIYSSENDNDFDDENLYNIINNNYRTLIRKITTQNVKRPVVFENNINKKIIKSSENKKSTVPVLEKEHKKAIISESLLDKDMIPNIISYYENLGYNKEDILKQFQILTPGAKEKILKTYSKDLILVSNPISESAKKQIISVIAHPTGMFCSYILSKCSREEKTYSPTPYNNEDIYSIYVYYGKKGIPTDIVDEAIKYLEHKDLNELYTYFSNRFIKKTTSIKNEQYLEYIINKIDYCICNLSYLTDTKKSNFLELLRKNNCSENSLEILYEALSDNEIKSLIDADKIIKTAQGNPHLQIMNTVMNIQKIDFLTNIREVFKTIGCDFDALPTETINKLSKFYDMTTGIAIHTLNINEITEIIQEYLEKNFYSLWTNYRFLIKYIFYLKKIYVLNFKYILQVYNQDLFKCLMLIDILEKDIQNVGRNLSKLEILIHYNYLKEIVIEYLEAYTDNKKKYNFRKEINEEKITEVKERYYKLKKL